MITTDKKAEMDFSSLSDQVFRHIRSMILNGELKGGERIPEEKIATSFGVSRTPIREALRKLEKHGLVEIIPRRHARVIKLEPIDKMYIGQLRIQLDSLSIRLLAQQATQQDYAELSGIAQQCEDYASQDDWLGCFEKDSELHCEFARRSGNPYLYDFVRTLDMKVQLLRTEEEELSIKRGISGIKHHMPIIEAVCANDAEQAVQLAIAHLKHFYFNEPL
jgi:DNA-binding GntR family transcriptional regulator